jgi:hypothetical protein
VGDQVQFADLRAQVFPPAVRAGHGLTVQHRDGRVERLEHREGRDVDAADGQPDSVPAQMVGERFDLGQFGHVSSVPVNSA